VAQTIPMGFNRYLEHVLPGIKLIRNISEFATTCPEIRVKQNMAFCEAN